MRTPLKDTPTPAELARLLRDQINGGPSYADDGKWLAVWGDQIAAALFRLSQAEQDLATMTEETREAQKFIAELDALRVRAEKAEQERDASDALVYELLMQREPVMDHVEYKRTRNESIERHKRYRQQRGTT